MKLYGIAGKGTGKVGSMVYAISGGEQIVRQYNPIVANPNTERQVTQRSKFKLMTQLAAALAPALAFRKQGLVSARNQFIAKNMPFVTMNGEVAEIQNENIQLTPSHIPFGLVGVRSEGVGSIVASVPESIGANLDRVAYFIFKVGDAGLLSLVQSVVIDGGDDNSDFNTTLSAGAGTALVLAYGIKDNTSTATIQYENAYTSPDMQLSAAEISALFSSGNYTLTATAGAIVQVTGEQ